MVKVENLLSSLAAAACTAAMAIAVWKVALGRPLDLDARPTKAEDPTTTEVFSDNGKKRQQVEVLAVESEHDDLKTPRPSRNDMSSKVDSPTQWKVGGSRQILLCSMVDKSSKPEDADWDSASDITEWSDDDENCHVFDTSKRPCQRSARWVQVGYGRYKKVK